MSNARVVEAANDELHRAWTPSNRLFIGMLVFFFAYSWMFADISVPNERSRVYLAMSLVDCGRVDIDCAVDRYGAINDWARAGNHYYTDKAPGSSFLAVIPYALARLFSRSRDWTIVDLVNLQRRLLMIPLSIVGALLLWRALAQLGVSRPSATVATAAWLLGSTALHYSAAFYGHQIVAVAILGAVYWGMMVEWRERRRTFGPTMWSGMACGLAGLVEYQAIPLALIVALGVLHRARGERDGTAVVWYIAGVVPFAALFFIYHTLAFGGPFELSYSHLVSKSIQASHTRGIGGVGLPHWDAAFGLAFSLHRGFLATSPVFIAALWGLARLQKRLGLVIFGCLTVSFLAASGADAWVGGWSFGPRLLVPVFGLATIPLGGELDAVRRSEREWVRGAVWAALAIGVLYNQLAQAVFPELPSDAVNPLRDVFWPMLQAGHLAPNVLSKLTGESELWTLLPLFLGLALLLAWTGYVLRPWPRARGQYTSAWRSWTRWLAAAAAVFVVFSAYVGLRKPGWSEEKWRKWEAVVETWEGVEAKR